MPQSSLKQTRAGIDFRRNFHNKPSSLGKATTPSVIEQTLQKSRDWQGKKSTVPAACTKSGHSLVESLHSIACQWFK